MSEQGTLFAEQPRYCIDTNVIISFLRGTDDEHYGADVFAPQWNFLQRLMFEGHIIAPRQVESELAKWDTKIGPMKAWLRGHHHIFRDVETNAQLEIAKRIVNAYPAYGESQNYLGDLEVITLAAARGITVISLEVSNPNPSKRRPKIPDVCAEFNVGCLSLPGFLRREGFGKTEG